ncbi:phage tail assembly chaperone GT [Virgibacillus kimchii]
MDKIVLDMMKNGKDVNEILNMPFNFMLEILAEKNKPEKKKSLIAAFGG